MLIEPYISGIHIRCFLRLVKTVLQQNRYKKKKKKRKPKYSSSLSSCAGLLYLFPCVLPVGPPLSSLIEIRFDGDCKCGKNKTSVKPFVLPAAVVLNDVSAVTDFIQYENVIKLKIQQGAAATSRSLNQFVVLLLGNVKAK